MKYTILVIALLFLASSFALKLRTSAKQDAAAAATTPPSDPCQELIDYDELFTNATIECTEGTIAALIPTPPDIEPSRMQEGEGAFSLDTLFAPVQGFIACMEGIMGEGQYTNSAAIFGQLELACAGDT